MNPIKKPYLGKKTEIGIFIFFTLVIFFALTTHNFLLDFQQKNCESDLIQNILATFGSNCWFLKFMSRNLQHLSRLMAVFSVLGIFIFFALELLTKRKLENNKRGD